MVKLFNIVMRIISSLIGLLMIFMGGVWTLQGLNLAFNGPIMNGRQSFMVGDTHWTVYGIILAVVGLGQVIWSNTRHKLD